MHLISYSVNMIVMSHFLLDCPITGLIWPALNLVPFNHSHYIKMLNICKIEHSKIPACNKMKLLLAGIHFYI